jgi:hypothetical protein
VGRAQGLALDEERALDLGRVRDLYALLAAVEVLPEGSVLYVEGTRAPDIAAFLASHLSAERQLIRRGTVWPRPKIFHLPITPSNLQQFRELADRHAEPEICDHLVVYRGDQVYLAAYDAGFGHVYVSRDLPPETIENLRDRLGTG